MSMAPSIPTVGFETIRVVSDGVSISGFLVEPSVAPGTAPILLILHEWWGLNDQIKGVARRFAEAGFVACVPNLYARQGGQATTNPAEASTLMSGVSSQAVLRDLNALTRALKQRPSGDPSRIAVVGFSMGGTLALTQACHNSDLKAAVIFYGKVPPIETFKYLLCPVLYHWAEQDSWIPQKEIELLRQGLTQAQRPGEIVAYPGCQHGFFNSMRPEVYNTEAADRAWRTTLAFLAQHLG